MCLFSGFFGSLPNAVAHTNENVSTMTILIYCGLWVAVIPGIFLYNGALYLSLMTWVTKLSDMATRVWLH